MCRLGGEFAGILRVEIPAAKKSALLAALQKLQTDGLQIVVRDGRSAAATTAGRADEIGNCRQRPAGHRPRNHPRARAGERERRGIFQRSRQRADVRRNLVQGQRASAIAGTLRPRRVEKGSGKNRRRFAGGCFVCRTRRLGGNCKAPKRLQRKIHVFFRAHDFAARWFFRHHRLRRFNFFFNLFRERRGLRRFKNFRFGNFFQARRDQNSFLRREVLRFRQRGARLARG